MQNQLAVNICQSLNDFCLHLRQLKFNIGQEGKTLEKQITTLTNTMNESKHEAEAYLYQMNKHWEKIRRQHMLMQKGSTGFVRHSTAETTQSDRN